MDQQQTLCFVLAVWNDAYVDLYLNYALPTHLAPGNIEAVTDFKHVYCIFTRADDKIRIEAHPLFKKLTSLITVRFTLIDEAITDNRLRAGYCFGLGVTFAKSINAAIFLVMPDVLFSEGSFKYVAQQLKRGYRAILVACHTTEKIAAIELLKQHIASDGTINISGRDCVDILMSAMHNNSKEKFYSETTGNLMPGCLCWYVGEQGILTHGLHLTPIVVLPRNMDHQFLGTIDREFIEEANIQPSEILVIEDSDTCAMFEIAAATHIVDSPYKKGNPDDIVDWAIIHANNQHRATFPMPARLKSNKYSDETAWLQVELQALAIVNYVQHELTQTKRSISHYFKFRYAYLRKFLLTLHSLEWQQKNYKYQKTGKFIVYVHNKYLVLAAAFASMQSKLHKNMLAKIHYWPNRLENCNMPLAGLVPRLEQLTLKHKSPMLVQMLLFPIVYPLIWLGIFIFNLLVGGLQIVRN